MAGAVNMDQYEAYFRRADLDGDGRISGPEAVTFFQGSNLAKHVLSQIWTYADQSKSGFLGRAEFYNALRLVTVAQSKRELTPDIVKAALYGPAAAKIPAPQINIPTTALPTLGTSTPQMGMPTPLSSQNYGFRPQGFPNPGAAQQNFPALQNQMMRPAQPTTSSSAPRAPQGIAGPEISRISSSGGLNVANSNVASDWLSGRTSMAPPGPRGIAPSVASAASIPQAPVSALSQSTGADSKALVPSGNGLPANSGFATELFSATSSIPKQEPAGMNFPASTPTSSAKMPVSSGSKTKQNGLDSFLLEPANSQFQRTPSLSSLLPTSGQTIPGSTSTSSVIVPVSSGNQTSSKLNALDSLSAFSLQPISGQFQPTQKQSLLIPGQHVPATAVSNDSHSTWPKMKPSDIQKYANVFMKVDTDRDGKITGEQARNLFLSWRLPREVLKQVWDLSDQDNDGMLSLREFSFALYLMEQYKEGRPLPPALPNNVLFDETLLSMTGQRKTVYASPASGFSQQQMMTGAQSMPPAAGQRPPFQGGSPGPDSKLQPNQQKPVALVLEDSFLMDNGEGNTRNSEGQAPITAEKKVQETENMILDSKEKIEFYRTKMQELVLYKSRCDNRLNEITERASADKREAESLAKKYEEKYKQVAEIASKLSIEEAKFRDIQERKMEFQQAITKMEQGGSADGIMQVRVDRIQSDLDALMRALKERCSKHGINVKSTTVIELPTGWQPGAPEVTAEWDEDWDKFEDEGFLNDLAIEGKKATPVQREENFIDNDSIHDSSPKAYLNKGELLSNGDYVSKSESVFNHSDDGFGRSPQDSPVGRSAFDSPVGRDAFDSPVGRAAFDSPDNPFRKGPGTDAETHRSFDESTWGAFDNNDDGDSVWGYNKDSDIEKPKDLFGTDDFRVNVVRTESPQGSPHGDSIFKAKSPFKFEDSVPGTPLSRFGNSPRYSEAGDHFFDNMSGFDPFSMHDDSFAVGPERLTRFDSINSSKDFGFSQDKFSRFDSISSSKDLGFGQDKFSRFDSISNTSDYGFGQDKFSRFDSVSNSRDFGYSNDKFSRSDSISSSKDFGYNSEKFTRFDSMSSTRDDGHGHAFSFDEPDPFGSSGPFKVSSDNQTPKKNSDNWKAF